MYVKKKKSTKYMNCIKYLCVVKKEFLCKFTLEFLKQVIDENYN